VGCAWLGNAPIQNDIDFGRYQGRWSSACDVSHYPPITYYWTCLIILDHSYLFGNLTNSKIAETIASKILIFLYQQFSNLLISNKIWVVQD
jgi:hypothetical protein